MPVETIVAKAHSDFGVNVTTAAGKEWWNGDSKSGMPAKKAEWQALIPAGRPTVVEYYVTQKGAKRITKVVSATTQNTQAKAPAVEVEHTKPAPTQADSSGVRTQYGRPLSAYEAEKDIRIHVSGILQAVASSPALAAFSTSPDEYLENVKKLTVDLLGFAQEEVTKRKELTV